MANHYDLVYAAFLALFVAVSWVGPRYFGLAGMLAGHLTVLLGWFYLAGLAIEVGRYEYHGAATMISLVLDVLMLNILLLPVGFLALWRRRRVTRRDVA